MSAVPQWLLTADHFWLVWGFVAQGLFSARFVVQWVASEIRKTSYLPRAFWYFSIAGSSGLIVYAAVRQDPVFLIGQILGLLIYLRNLVLMGKDRALDSRTGPV
jgi:lipid-A-disaccharide synthase-like uncharacterized protein